MTIRLSGDSHHRLFTKAERQLFQSHDSDSHDHGRNMDVKPETQIYHMIDTRQIGVILMLFNESGTDKPPLRNRYAPFPFSIIYM